VRLLRVGTIVFCVFSYLSGSSTSAAVLRVPCCVAHRRQHDLSLDRVSLPLPPPRMLLLVGTCDSVVYVSMWCVIQTPMHNGVPFGAYMSQCGVCEHAACECVCVCLCVCLCILTLADLVYAPPAKMKQKMPGLKNTGSSHCFLRVT